MCDGRKQDEVRLCGCNHKSNEHCLHLAVNFSAQHNAGMPCASYLVSNYPEESNLILGFLIKIKKLRLVSVNIF